MEKKLTSIILPPQNKSLNKVTIAIDAIGGDHGLRTTIPASVLALKKYPNLELILVGNKKTLEIILSKKKILSSTLTYTSCF